MHLKEEGGHDPTLCALNLQQPHSTSSTDKEGKYNLEQLNAFGVMELVPYGIPPVHEVQQSTRKGHFVHLNSQIILETHIKQ